MNIRKIIRISLFFMGMIVAIISASPSITVGDLSIGYHWIRASTGPNTAAYLTITNTSGQLDKLIKVECADTHTVELHNHINDNGVMKMRPVDAIEIGKDPVELKPGGLHIMLMGLKDSFKDKESIPLTLHFENAGPITLDFPVKAPEVLPLQR